MLTESQKKQLNKFPVGKILDYIVKGNVKFPDDLEFVDEIKIQQIKELLPSYRRDKDESQTSFKEKRAALFKVICNKPFYEGGIPCYAKSEDRILESDLSCEICGYKMMKVLVSSPAHFWQHLSGREGWVTICPHCGQHGNIDIVIMN